MKVERNRDILSVFSPNQFQQITAHVCAHAMVLKPYYTS